MTLPCPSTGARVRRRGGGRAGFTLVELLVVVSILAILATLVLSGYRVYLNLATRAHCSSNLRQLGTAVLLYTQDNNGAFPPYVKNNTDGSKMWFFGKEPSQPGVAEGARNLDREAGPLYPYIEAVGSVEVCKGFNYGSALWKAKFKGASYGYGYNWALGGRNSGSPMNMVELRSSASVILMGDCGQVNTFQKPASPSKPMIEEFYIINETYRTVHFRHNNRANMLFVDGHVELFKPFPGTEDKRVKGELLGRITAAGSTEYLK